MTKRETERESAGGFTSSEDDDEVSRLLGQDLSQLDNAADDIMNSIRETSNDLAGEDDDSDEDMATGGKHDDDGMGDEILRLGNVVANLRQDLDSQSVDSMTSALSAIDGSPNQRYRYNEKSLLTMQAEEAEKFIRSHHLYGPGVGGEEHNSPLIIFTALVWCFLLLLVYHVKYGAMDSDGGISYLPGILQFL